MNGFRIIIVLLITALVSLILGQQALGAGTIDPLNFRGEYQLDSTKLTATEKTALTYAQKYGGIYGISPALIMAIIDRESTFKADSVGDSGLAIGYMQLHWDAAYDAGYRSSSGEAKELAKSDWPTDGKDPDTNIKFGCGYLKLCYDKCGNSDIYAGDALKNTISSYNQGWPHGPDRVNEDTYVNPIISKYNYYKQFITTSVRTPKVGDHVVITVASDGDNYAWYEGQITDIGNELICLSVTSTMSGGVPTPYDNCIGVNSIIELTWR